MLGTGELRLEQTDGGPPATLAAGHAAGESGVSILSVRFRGGAHFSITARQHVVCFVSRVRIECNMAGRLLRHEAPAGSLAICPAGIDAVAHAAQSVDAIVVKIDPGHLALAAAEDSALEAQLMQRPLGFDLPLLDLARNLASETANDYPNGPLSWNEAASRFIAGLVARHTLHCEQPARGTLSKDVLTRLRDYVMAHLDEPIEVPTLANIAGRSPFHFTRVFTRSVGVSPHRYVVHLRLQRAIELVRDGQSGLAEIAAYTGFADQSHLTRWVRRVHGVSLTRLVAGSRRARIFKISRSRSL
jgi:AraC family transcriptional regulator